MPPPFLECRVKRGKGLFLFCFFFNGDNKVARSCPKITARSFHAVKKVGKGRGGRRCQCETGVV